MAVLTVTLLSVIAHLALGQLQMASMNGFARGGAMRGDWGPGMHSGWGSGEDAGWGKDMHSGWGKDEGTGWDMGWGKDMHSGWGKDMHSGWGKDMHSGWGKDMHSGWGMGMHSGWGKGWEEDSYDKTTITCTFEDQEISGSVTLRESKGSKGGWGWGQQKKSVKGELRINTGDISGYGKGDTYRIVFTELSRVEGGCTPDGLGRVLKKTTWGHPWGSWGSRKSSGVVKTIDLDSDSHYTVDLHSNLPFDGLEGFAGRGFALCSDMATVAGDEHECAEPIIACCKLGFDDQDAETPPPPSSEYTK